MVSIWYLDVSHPTLFLHGVAHYFRLVRTARNFDWFAKVSISGKPFLVPMICCTNQHVCKRNETSKIPSNSFRGCKKFCQAKKPFVPWHPSEIRPSNFAANGLQSERDRMTSCSGCWLCYWTFSSFDGDLASSTLSRTFNLFLCSCSSSSTLKKPTQQNTMERVEIKEAKGRHILLLNSHDTDDINPQFYNVCGRL